MNLRRSLSLVSALLLLAACAAPPARTQQAPRLIAYLGGRQAETPIPAQHLTAINYAFGHIRDGRIVLDQADTPASLERLRALRAQQAGLEILVSVGGWGADGFSDAAATAESRAAFADSAAQVLRATALDGIDLDWEYPGLPGPGIRFRADVDAHNFSALLAALRARFDALAAETRHAPYRLSVALADGEFVAHVELGTIHRYLDWINLMTYDFHNSLTPTTGHHAALRVSATAAPAERSVETAVAQYLAAGVPAHKLVVGVPFYGRAFADVDDANHGLDQHYGHFSGAPAWPELVADWIDRNGYVRYWDAAAQVPYLWNAQKREFVSYDDAQSLALKTEYVKAHGLGGVMYWEQSLDPNGELTGVLARGLGRP